MNWYIAKLVFNVNINHGEHRTQFDESFRMLEALNLEDAKEKAWQLGKCNDETFTNVHGDIIHWDFVAVEHIAPITRVTDGQEIFSQTRIEILPAEYAKGLQMKTQFNRPKTIVPIFESQN